MGVPDHILESIRECAVVEFRAMTKSIWRNFGDVNHDSPEEKERLDLVKSAILMQVSDMIYDEVKRLNPDINAQADATIQKAKGN